MKVRFFLPIAKRICASLMAILQISLARGLHAGPREDASTLAGKVMCGYQGWFNCEGDGADRGWAHWTKGRGPLSPANAEIDLWPDVSELTPGERFATE